METARIDEHLRHGIGRAAGLGLKMVVFGNLNTKSRRAPDEFSHEQAWKQLVDFGVRVRQKLRNTTVAEALDLIRAVNLSSFRMLADYSFMAQGKEDLATCTRRAGTSGRSRSPIPMGAFTHEARMRQTPPRSSVL
jgi:hypothetical protein